MSNEKDLTQMQLEDHNDVFEDIINVLLFNGERVIRAEELEDILPKSQYKAETGVLHEEERDIAKAWRKGQFRLATIGLEDQSAHCKFMPLRIIAYDGANYREQLLDKHIRYAYPVLSIVLNFTMHRWRSHRTLHECLDIPEPFLPYINDYKIHVFDIAFLSDEKIGMFRSDFRIVARYFADRRRKRPFRFPDKVPEHVDEVLKLLSVLTGDRRFSEQWVISEGEEKENINMAEKWIDEIEERGEAKGKILAYYDCGTPIDTIAEKVGKTVDYVTQVLNLSPTVAGR
ncbi:MAG: Rpn family recombination-promoting nuclease/putative transposase [Eubacterium sp.]|nr:Rpn family recombination-promoting nuclease/putative transposase [Eubacterium sp.]